MRAEAAVSLLILGREEGRGRAEVLLDRESGYERGRILYSLRRVTDRETIESLLPKIRGIAEDREAPYGDRESARRILRNVKTA